jgi:ABC-type branched-subunit amino acid transport system permease subunit
MVLGIIMLLIILFRPGGLWAIYEGLAARFRRAPKADTRA